MSASTRCILKPMGTKSRDRLYGTSVRIAAERAAEARKEADKLACEAWTKRMLAFQGPAQTVADARRRPQCGLRREHSSSAVSHFLARLDRQAVEGACFNPRSPRRRWLREVRAPA